MLQQEKRIVTLAFSFNGSEQRRKKSFVRELHDREGMVHCGRDDVEIVILK